MTELGLPAASGGRSNTAAKAAKPKQKKLAAMTRKFWPNRKPVEGEPGKDDIIVPNLNDKELAELSDAEVAELPSRWGPLPDHAYETLKPKPRSELAPALIPLNDVLLYMWPDCMCESQKVQTKCVHFCVGKLPPSHARCAFAKFMVLSIQDRVRVILFYLFNLTGIAKTNDWHCSLHLVMC